MNGLTTRVLGFLRKRYLWVAAILVVVAAVIAVFISQSPETRRKVIIVDDNTPLSELERLTIDSGTKDIQAALNEAAASGKIAYFDNSSGDQVYRINKTLIIPNGAIMVGNGATLLIDSSTPFTQIKTGSIYKEFAIMTKGMTDKKRTTFYMENLNFLMQDDRVDSNIPRTIFCLAYCDKSIIDGCSFVTQSSIRAFKSPFDAYAEWNGITVRNTRFACLTDSDQGGVWFRNFNGQSTAGNSLIQNCVFENRAADEILCVWGSTTGAVDNVTITGCQFTNMTSEYNNPAHFVRFGNTGLTNNIVFENNSIYMECVFNSVINLSANNGTSDNIFVRNNQIVVDDIASTSGNIITGDSNEHTVVVENNDITVRTKSGTMKSGVSGATVIVRGNRFYGNGFEYITAGVMDVQDNEVEQCKNAFRSVVTCIGNTVNDCAGSFVTVVGNTNTGTPDARKQVVIQDNKFSASGAKAIFNMASADLYCDVEFSGNEIRNGRLLLSNKTSTNNLLNNRFYIITLDDIATGGTTQQFENNYFYDLSGKSLLSATSAPKSTNFNNSVPVGALVAIDETVSITNELADKSRIAAAAGRMSAGVLGAKVTRTVVGYRKEAAGASWLTVEDEKVDLDEQGRNTVTELPDNPLTSDGAPPVLLNPKPNDTGSEEGDGEAAAGEEQPLDGNTDSSPAESSQ